MELSSLFAHLSVFYTRIWTLWEQSLHLMPPRHQEWSWLQWWTHTNTFSAPFPCHYLASFGHWFGTCFLLTHVWRRRSTPSRGVASPASVVPDNGRVGSWLRNSSEPVFFTVELKCHQFLFQNRPRNQTKQNKTPVPCQTNKSESLEVRTHPGIF